MPISPVKKTACEAVIADHICCRDTPIIMDKIKLPAKIDYPFFTMAPRTSTFSSIEKSFVGNCFGREASSKVPGGKVAWPS